MREIELENLLKRVETLPCWAGKAHAKPLGGGITNRNFVVSDAKSKFMVRLGDDIPEHGIMRFNELSASQAAEKAGVSPAVRYHEHGALVMDFIEGRTLGAEEIRADPLPAVALLVRAHREMAAHLQGSLLTFWPFQVVQNYLNELHKMASKNRPKLGQVRPKLEILRQAIGTIDPTYCHNDLLAANFIDDGKRLWLIDWDYGGFNSPLFDLANFSTNSELSVEAEGAVLQCYFGRAPDARLWKQFNAMRCMSLLRETLWSMVSEIRSTIDFDYAAYTEDYVRRFEQAYERFEAAR